MVPAPAGDGPARLAFLLTGDQDHADRLVRAALTGEAADGTAALVRAWLADPGDCYPPDPSPAEPAKERLRRALGELLPRQRAAVVLRYWTALPVEAVAAALGCPEQAVVAETTVALELLAVDGDRLAARLAALAADARPAPVDPAGPGAGRRQRVRSVGVAVVVLAAAGVFAAVLGVEEPASAPPVADSGEWSPPPTVWTIPLIPPGLPTITPPEDAVAVIDDRSRRLTEQLLAAMPRVLPGVVELRPGPIGPQIVNLPRPALEFYTGVTLDPGSYLAQASYGSPPETTVLVIEVRFRDPADPRRPPCPELRRDCTFSLLPDGTWAEVSVYTDPATDQTIHGLTAQRSDGTFFHVTAFNLERSPFPPKLAVADLLRFADVFTY